MKHFATKVWGVDSCRLPLATFGVKGFVDRLLFRQLTMVATAGVGEIDDPADVDAIMAMTAVETCWSYGRSNGWGDCTASTSSCNSYGRTSF
ncbi:hypothetical protein [Gluconacetobacter takamatsuzukensis]|uniref:Uncharacterized protein n=1 Tax=Gluconacetobacter takamatsuzukensis TaxID=1286190 RepID=A0A7W4PQE2_9PROT|nr:hypothetical protein [Gluconacetobacter takamatsuzukensis]MBB2206440.1 hypothetical protein [Gluconacetobacter takamatsuzukensis]